MYQNLLKQIARALDHQNIPYMIIGGQAVLLYGEPRLTKDIDITLGINVDELDKILSAAQALNLRILVDDPEKFTGETMVLPVQDIENDIRIDFIFSFSPYERQALNRTNNIKLGEDLIRFASLEDVVIHKVISGRPRDIEDVQGILLKNPDFDVQYIEKWLQNFDESLHENFLKVFHGIIANLS